MTTVTPILWSSAVQVCGPIHSSHIPGQDLGCHGWPLGPACLSSSPGHHKWSRQRQTAQCWCRSCQGWLDIVLPCWHKTAPKLWGHDQEGSLCMWTQLLLGSLWRNQDWCRSQEIIMYSFATMPLVPLHLLSQISIYNLKVQLTWPISVIFNLLWYFEKNFDKQKNSLTKKHNAERGLSMDGETIWNPVWNSTVDCMDCITGDSKGATLGLECVLFLWLICGCKTSGWSNKVHIRVTNLAISFFGLHLLFIGLHFHWW